MGIRNYFRKTLLLFATNYSVQMGETVERSLKDISKNNYLLENMQKSYDFWHKIYEDSPINIPLIWKKAIDTNFELQSDMQKTWKNNLENVSKIQMQQFLDWWALMIKQPMFRIESRTIREWEEIWKNTTDQQFKVYADILDMFEKYWKNIQDKNIE